MLMMMMHGRVARHGGKLVRIVAAAAAAVAVRGLRQFALHGIVGLQVARLASPMLPPAACHKDDHQRGQRGEHYGRAGHNRGTHSRRHARVEAAQLVLLLLLLKMMMMLRYGGGCRCRWTASKAMAGELEIEQIVCTCHFVLNGIDNIAVVHGYR